jgi:hypothetical protein
MNPKAAMLSIGETQANGMIGQIDFAVFVMGLGMDVHTNGRKEDGSGGVAFQNIVGDLGYTGGVCFALGEVREFRMVRDV